MQYHPEWTMAGQYIDEGITGTSAENRPEFMRMMSDARSHQFDMILTREVSRFARNTVDTLQYTRMLREHGVEVYFINDGIKTFDGDGELRLTIMASLSQDESRKTSVRVKSGQQVSMENGVVYGNGNILGYDRVGKEMVINPEQARTVRLIYDLYLDGHGLVKIKDELERRGYKASMGKDKWHPRVISNVLQNPFYYGLMVYHKEYTPDYLKQKKVKNYGEIEQVQVWGTHEPIVTEEEWHQVQEIKAGRIKENFSPATGKKTSHCVKDNKDLWGSKLQCSCGCSFRKNVWHRYNNRRRYRI